RLGEQRARLQPSAPGDQRCVRFAVRGVRTARAACPERGGRRGTPPEYPGGDRNDRRGGRVSEAADRRGERRLFVRIESHDDPVQGLDGDHALLARAAESEAPHVYLRLWWNAPCIVLGRGYAAGLPRRVD